MREYVCASQGHRLTYNAPPGPDERCPHDNSALLGPDAPAPAPGVAAPAPPSRRRADPLSATGLRPIRLLRLALAGATITVEPGNRVMLGRDPEYSPYAEQLGQHINVSRRHAELGLDTNGRAWIRDCYSTNLTRVDAVPLAPGSDRELRDGSNVRLCRGVLGTIELIRERPDGS
jgi:hypothetical protein